MSGHKIVTEERYEYLKARMKELLAKQGSVTEEEVSEYYEAHKEEIRERISKELCQTKDTSIY